MKKSEGMGVLAFGSLINDPGSELLGAEVQRISVRTPFPVGFARYSRSRRGAPTLVPVSKGGCRIKAQVIVLSPDTCFERAADMLWRRETHRVCSGKGYHPQHIRNAVRIKVINGLGGVNKVLYTDFYAVSKIRAPKPITLARRAILSARSARDGKDGITYLSDAKRCGIRTPLMKQYELEILRLTGTCSLREALEKVQREMTGSPLSPNQ
jgi:hypothetical protein